jgi:hypothetical protein
MGSESGSGRRQPASPAPDGGAREVVTSSYRAAFGGPRGVDNSAWTSRASDTPTRGSSRSTPHGAQSSDSPTSSTPGSAAATSALPRTSSETAAAPRGAGDVPAAVRAEMGAAAGYAEAAIDAARGRLAAAAARPAAADESAAELDGPAAAAAMTRSAPELVSMLTAGAPKEQEAAAHALLRAMRAVGAPLRAAAHEAGGTHVLATLVSEGGAAGGGRGAASLRVPAMEALAEIMQHAPARAEIAAAPGVASRAVGAAVAALASGRPEGARLLAALAATPGNDVRVALAQHKAVRALADALAAAAPAQPEDGAPPAEGAREAAAAALEALCAVCAADAGGSALRKVAWGGGLAALVPLVGGAGGEPARGAALDLLLRALRVNAGFADSLATPAAIRTLASFVAAPERALAAQAAAAEVLAFVAALPALRREAVAALVDHAVPRACEVVHQPAGGGGEADAPAEAALRAACGALLAHAAAASRLACHALLFHGELLPPAVAALVASRQHALAGRLLEAAGAYAADPTECA